MNRLEKLKLEMADQIPKVCCDIAFKFGWDGASAEYEKIIAELEGALEYYSIECTWNENRDVAAEALQKLKEFKS